MISETVRTADLKPHPRNYRHHSKAQLEHLEASLREHGVYRNVVIARDGTLLAGHGVVAAARKMGLAELPVRRVDLDPNDAQALKILTADNELARLAIDDEKALADLLAEVKEEDLTGLLGTGHDDLSLARLLLLTHDELTTEDADALWGGMPGFKSTDDRLKVTINFVNEADRAEFARRLDLPVEKLEHMRVWWPPREQDDSVSIAYR